MQCIRCGIDIGDRLGACEACQALGKKIREEAATELVGASQPGTKAPNVHQFPMAESVLRFASSAREVYQLCPPVFIALALILFVGIVAYTDIGWRPEVLYRTSRRAGITFPNEPRQVTIAIPPWKVEDSQFTALAQYELEGLLLFNIPYRKSSDSTHLSPLDLVVSWGPLSDSAVLRRIKFSHGNRVVYVRMSDDLAFDPGPFLSHIHAIPASKEIERVLLDLNADRGVYLKGKLVRVERDGWLPWESSLSRNDSNCEIMWVEEARQLPITRTP